MRDIKDLIPVAVRMILRREFTFNSNGVDLTTREFTYRKMINLGLLALGASLKTSRPFGYPAYAQIEPSSACNLKCPLCPTTEGHLGRYQANLDLATFQKYIDEVGKYLVHITFWGWGEPFINRNLCEMIRYASERNIRSSTSTNGHFIRNEDEARQVVSSGLDVLIVAIDGMTQGVYERYRVRGELAKVQQAIKLMVAAKRTLGSDLPHIVVRTVAMNSNQHQLVDLRAFAEAAGVDFFSVKGVCFNNYDPQEGARFASPELGAFNRYFERGGVYQVIRNERFRCYRPYVNAFMFSDGTVLPCENDSRARHGYGSMREGSSFASLWRGIDAKTFRTRFRKDMDQFHFCRDCNYRAYPKSDSYIEIVDLKSGVRRMTSAGSEIPLNVGFPS